MARRTTKRLISAVTLPLWKRDQLEMRAVNQLLGVLAPQRKPRRAGATRRARSTRRTR